MPRAPINEQFYQRLLRYSRRRRNGCRDWIGGKYKDGYGRVRFNWSEWQAHRAAYHVWVGEIPKGLCVCHYCDNPSCINPAHLFLATHSENIADRQRKGRTRWNPKAGDNGRNARRNALGQFMCGV